MIQAYNVYIQQLRHPVGVQRDEIRHSVWIRVMKNFELTIGCNHHQLCLDLASLNHTRLIQSFNTHVKSYTLVELSRLIKSVDR